VLKGVMKKNTIIHVRFHPFCSRHGGHLYQWTNKAFIHLVFTEDELKEMGAPEDVFPKQKVIHPKWSYDMWVKDAGLRVANRDHIKTPMEGLFKNNKDLKTRIHKHWLGKSFDPKVRNGKVFPEIPLSIDFMDYQIKL